MGGAFWTKLVGQNAALADCFQWYSHNLTFLTPVNPSNVKVSWSIPILKPNLIGNSQNLVWQEMKLVGQSSKLVGRLPHQLYRKLRPCNRSEVY